MKKETNPQVEYILQESRLKQIVEFKEYLNYLLRLITGPIVIDEHIIGNAYEDYKKFCLRDKRNYLPLTNKMFWKIMNSYGFHTTTYYLKDKEKEKDRYKRGIKLNELVIRKMLEEFSKFTVTRNIQVVTIEGKLYFLTTSIAPVDTELSKHLKK